MTDQSEAEWQKGLAFYNAFNIDDGVADIAATLAVARTLPGASGKVGLVGLVGFCLGGLMTFLCAIRVGADAAVAYYGGGTDNYVGEANKLVTPLLMHLAEDDEFISKDAQRIIINALKNNSLVEIHTYPGCSHAFARNGGQHYDADAAASANARTLDFFRTQLG